MISRNRSPTCFTASKVGSDVGYCLKLPIFIQIAHNRTGQAALDFCSHLLNRMKEPETTSPQINHLPVLNVVRVSESCFDRDAHIVSSTIT